MSRLVDKEFGPITLRRSARSSAVRIRIAPDGRLRASLPLYAPIFLVKRLINTSRHELRDMLAQQQDQTQYSDGMAIGKSHSLIVKPVSSTSQPSIQRQAQRLVVSLPDGLDLNHVEVAQIIRDEVIKTLRREAKSYLPKRLAWLARGGDWSYERVRFSHASGRWGSCSSNGTISLNIALMKLPFELIDYVLIHELSHTIEMNHSKAFWDLVEAADPDYKIHRKAMKDHTPTI